MTLRKMLPIFLAVVVISVFTQAADKPKLTLDEFFDSVYFTAVKMAPDGQSVVIGTERADWGQNVFRDDLWLYRVEAGTLTQLTRSGKDSAPQWSPDGRWIAFLSERSQAAPKEDAEKSTDTSQVYLISPSGGEAFPVTQGDEEAHAFAWSADSRTLYFATRTPWTKEQKEAHKKEWKEVQRYRGDERGDVIFSIEVAQAIARAATIAQAEDTEKSAGTPGAQKVASTPWRVDELTASPDGRRLAFMSSSVSQRWEKVSEFEIYKVELTGSSGEKQPQQLTRNEAVEVDLRWARDGKHLFFQVDLGSVEGRYKDLQKRLYWVDAETGAAQRWAADFDGTVERYAVAADGSVLATGRLGTEVQLYTQRKNSDVFAKQAGWAGTYERLSASAQGSRFAFIHSTLEKPSEVYVADSLDKVQNARSITSFNRLFTERDLPKGKPYRWTSDDGTAVEGMLMYPPGKFEAKNLPMFVLIHGGPADADGNHFEADWYQWDRLAATQGWLVFEPNYRGSTGYGDKFLMGIVPEIVSRPGKDILAGVNALVNDGIADPNRLTIGGYSYGGYMTNWLITQTTRFKAAVTGAGAVEHVANWGNDDTTMDDAYFLGGLPWEAYQRYHDEAAIFQIDKVKTPTHMVAGEDDIRVAVAENYLLDHALHNLGIPSALLIFPGEGHSLDKNPWHGKIKVR
ncbi:MAG TPA: S9 family peptidase, partial [Terriglobales bacterium]